MHACPGSRETFPVKEKLRGSEKVSQDSPVKIPLTLPQVWVYHTHKYTAFRPASRNPVQAGRPEGSGLPCGGGCALGAARKKVCNLPRQKLFWKKLFFCLDIFLLVV